LSAADAAATDTAAEQKQQQRQNAEEDGKDDEREQVDHGPLAVSSGEVRRALAVVVIRPASSLGAPGPVLTRPVRTPAVIYTVAHRNRT